MVLGRYRYDRIPHSAERKRGLGKTGEIHLKMQFTIDSEELIPANASLVLFTAGRNRPATTVPLKLRHSVDSAQRFTINEEFFLRPEQFVAWNILVGFRGSGIVEVQEMTVRAK